MVLRVILTILALYLAFKLVFNLIIPVWRTSRALKRGFREMKNNMQARQEEATRQQETREEQKAVVGDYIDFEEVK